ncbi:MAG TPA: hypothetical protein VH391_08495 [Solirubrobacterales bacterium]
MDMSWLNRGEKIAGVSGALLIVIMFVFPWFAVKLGAGVVALPNERTRDAWSSYGFTDVVLLVTAVAAIGLVLLAAAGRSRPTLASSLVAGLGLASVVLVVISIISPPTLGFASGPGIEHSRKIGVWLGLLAALGVAVGGYMAAQEDEPSSDP